MQIAVEGCCHGDLDKIYATLQAMEIKEGRSIDLLICCGDFQVSTSSFLVSTRIQQGRQASHTAASSWRAKSLQGQVACSHCV